MIRGNLISSRRRYGIWTTIRESLLGVLDDMRDDSGKAAPSHSISLLPSLSPSLGEDFGLTRVQSGDSTTRTLNTLKLSFSTFQRTYRPIGRAEVLLSDLISSRLNLVTGKAAKSISTKLTELSGSEIQDALDAGLIG